MVLYYLQLPAPNERGDWEMKRLTTLWFEIVDLNDTLGIVLINWRAASILKIFIIYFTTKISRSLDDLRKPSLHWKAIYKYLKIKILKLNKYVHEIRNIGTSSLLYRNLNF